MSIWYYWHTETKQHKKTGGSWFVVLFSVPSILDHFLLPLGNSYTNGVFITFLQAEDAPSRFYLMMLDVLVICLQLMYMQASARVSAAAQYENDDDHNNHDPNNLLV